MNVINRGVSTVSFFMRKCQHNAYPAQLFHDYYLARLPTVKNLKRELNLPEKVHACPENLDKSKELQQSGSVSRLNWIKPIIDRSECQAFNVFRIPIQSAKSHFGASTIPGCRPYNEDTYQVGILNIPPFANPLCKTAKPSDNKCSKYTKSDNSQHPGTDDPQVFYFGIFDGHGGDLCSKFLQEKLHEYLEDTWNLYEIKSSLINGESRASRGKNKASRTIPKNKESPNILEMQCILLNNWKSSIGGYFKRFKPKYLSSDTFNNTAPTIITHRHLKQSTGVNDESTTHIQQDRVKDGKIERALEYAFLKADLDFLSISTKQEKSEDESSLAKVALKNYKESTQSAPSSMSKPKKTTRFVGGSTCSIALISTPTHTPFWDPTAKATLVVAHVGDSRIILCSTETGLAIPLTDVHHLPLPTESNRLRRYSGMAMVDSFSEQRLVGFANSRAFGDYPGKPYGITAEPQIQCIELDVSEYSFFVMVTDGVSGVLSDQEVIDIIRESSTPEIGAHNVTKFATDIVSDADNATALVVRLGGWSKRMQGSVPSNQTKALRDCRIQTQFSPQNWR